MWHRDPKKEGGVRESYGSVGAAEWTEEWYSRKKRNCVQGEEIFGWRSEVFPENRIKRNLKIPPKIPIEGTAGSYTSSKPYALRRKLILLKVVDFYKETSTKPD